MAVHPTTRHEGAAAFHLAPFDPAGAERVASWVHDEREAYWLAPKTPPPITAAHVRRWNEPDHHPFALVPAPQGQPIGYGELNRFQQPPRRYWIGHVIIDPVWRGCGYGLQMTRLLLAEAFEQRGARHVSLVVFLENRAAVACYRAAGMREDGFEWHSFPAYGTHVRLIRLVAEAS